MLLRDLTIRADRINGLGTTVRNVYGEVIYADPTAIEDGVLVLGGPPKSPPPATPKPPDGKPAAGSAAACDAEGRRGQAGPGDGGGRPHLRLPRSSPPAPAAIVAAGSCGGPPRRSPSHARRRRVIVDGATPPTARHRAASRGGPRAASEAEGEGQDPARRGREHPVRTDARAGGSLPGPAEPRLHDAGPGRNEGRRDGRPRSRRKPTGPTTSSPRRPGRRCRGREGRQGRAEEERHPRPAPDALQPEGGGDHAGHGQLPDGEGADGLEARHQQLPGLAPGAPTVGDRGVGRPLPGAPRRRLPSERLHDQRHLRGRAERQRHRQGRRAHRPQAGRRPEGARGPLARRLGLPGGRGEALRQARTPRRGIVATDDPLGRPSRRAAGPRRRDPLRPARSQGVARVVRQAAEDARRRRTCSWPGRRTARSSRSPASWKGPTATGCASATRTRAGRSPSRWSRAWSWPRARSPHSRPRPSQVFSLPGAVVSGRWKDLDTAVWKVETAWGQEPEAPGRRKSSACGSGGQR